MSSSAYSGTLRPAGENGLLVELPDQNAVHHVTDWLMTGEYADAVEDVVPSDRTVLVIARRSLPDIAASLRDLAARRVPERRAPRTLEIPISYSGPDLDEVCERTGIDRRAFARLHSGAEHVVAFFGFTPGFPYLSGVPEPLRVPRRATPRTRIPAGSVAIANGFTVVYPGGTPGGWNLIGHATCPPLWDVDRTPPNLLSIGDRVRFLEHR